MPDNTTYYDTSTGRSDEIDTLIAVAATAVEGPVAAFVRDMSERLATIEAETPYKLGINETRIAKEIARALVLDIVHGGIRSFENGKALRSDTVLEVYEQACVEAERAVELALRRSAGDGDDEEN
ncbi:hypothetical protein GGD81_001292 [Rhodobium orientis]|uniref:Uncharacterized protein n=1 Tax=Rhodobium orientis TaxID=34017 RepID=A0A327JSD3_9HYPH|nr:hypothetical protein [Rhodobium orientis]MBB4302265.1 hypothetical protein [Rhodobium orientis]MBK5948975.1 hypothetical protein [Rhodobium orientis]RAI28971.1 hypothetical protein CH339_04605 [Rhodobium orientis]